MVVLTIQANDVPVMYVHFYVAVVLGIGDRLPFMANTCHESERLVLVMLVRVLACVVKRCGTAFALKAL
jgi:hypothetical protein